jgi:hypothetical protein
MTSTRQKKRKPEQIVAKLRDALASDCREGHGGGSAGHARFHPRRWPQRASPTVFRLNRGEYAGSTNPEQAGLPSGSRACSGFTVPRLSRHLGPVGHPR